MKSKLTRERIEWLNYAATGLVANGTEMAMSPQDVIALTESCLAAMDSEPVAWLHNNNDLGIPAITTSPKIGHYWTTEFKDVQPLYRHAQQPVLPDEMLCDFYEVSNWADLVRELVKHVEQLQDSAKRNVKPWEDTFPETLLPAYIDRIKQADEACRAAMLAAAPQEVKS